MRKNAIVKHGFWREIIKNKYIYLLALPGIIYFLIFSYIPITGTIVAFKDYRISKGIWGSDWNGIENFRFFFESGKAWLVTKNTLLLNIIFIVVTTTSQVFFAVLLSEIRNSLYKKVCQSFMFLPYFISWMVVSVIVMGFLEYDTGVVNNTLEAFGMQPVGWYGSPGIWPALLAGFHMWKWTGYGVVIFLAAITGFDVELYEAATIDGASRLQKVLHITLPLLRPVIIVMTLLAVGRIFYGDFGMIYALVGDTSPLFPTTDVIDTYTYRALRKLSDFGMAGAVGLYQTVIGFVFLFTFNTIIRRIDPDSALF